MGRMTLDVDGKLAPVINETDAFRSDCYDQFTVNIDVPSGTRYVTIVPEGPGVFPSTIVTESITSDTNYVLILDGYINSQQSLNTQNSKITIVVRDTNSTGNVLETRIYRRTHTGNYC